MRNEDASVCDPPLFAVADGMGGAQAGELASHLAATALAERERRSRGEDAVAELVQAANARVYRRAVEDPAVAGMGTTVTVALFDGDSGTIAVGHVGDSRAYRIRDGSLEQLTADHSLVAELVRSGRLTPEQAAGHPHRSVITRALGTEASVDVDTFTIEASPGDLYLLCSDGLTTMVPDVEILALADGAGGAPDSLARELVDAANRAGGEDNITVVVFEVEEGVEEPETVVERPADDAPASAPAVPVRRRGAGKGGRLLALLGLVVVLAVAAYLVWRTVG
jgi:protein phosphatase